MSKDNGDALMKRAENLLKDILAEDDPDVINLLAWKIRRSVKREPGSLSQEDFLELAKQHGYSP